jgi:hypothetical protein
LIKLIERKVVGDCDAVKARFAKVSVNSLLRRAGAC